MSNEIKTQLGLEAYDGRLSRSEMSKKVKQLLRAVDEGDGRTACAIWHSPKALELALSDALTAHYTEETGHTFIDGFGGLRVIKETKTEVVRKEKLLPLSQLSEEQKAAARALGILVSEEKEKPATPRMVTVVLPRGYKG